MFYRVLFALPLALFGSMLSDAEKIGQEYALAIAKKTSPPISPIPGKLLDVSSTWLSIDLATIAEVNGQNALAELAQDSFWQIAQTLEINGLYLQSLRETTDKEAIISLSLQPKWESAWPKFMQMAQKYGVALIGDLIGPATGIGPDFDLAIKKTGDYPDLYHLLPIDQKDWDLLPSVPSGAISVNIPWLQLEALYKRGYVPEQAHPYIKESAWNTTGKVLCQDGKIRRWIFLKTNANDPVLNWLSPSLATGRLLAADALSAMYRYGQRIATLDAKLPRPAKESTSLWIRKLGGFSAEKNAASIEELQSSELDVSYDHLTRPALLHALIAEDAEALRLMYKLFLQGGIAQSRLIHSLEPFDRFSCDWTEFLSNPKKNYTYYDEIITGAILRNRLLKEDLMSLTGSSRNSLPISTWGGYCAMAFGVSSPSDFEKHADEIQKAHLLLALTYAMQPGIFSFSLSDLVGALPQNTQKLQLFGPNSGSLYPSIPCQLQSPRSFASQLKSILSLRKKSRIASGELLAVLPTTNPGSFLLLERLPTSRFLQLLAINFSRQPAHEQIELAEIRGSWAIEMLSMQAQEKGFDSGLFSFDLPALTGKVFLFQPKYAD